MFHQSSPSWSIELVYRILDYLQPSHILILVYCACARWNSIIDTYQLYQVKLTRCILRPLLISSVSWVWVKSAFEMADQRMSATSTPTLHKSTLSALNHPSHIHHPLLPNFNIFLSLFRTSAFCIFTRPRWLPSETPRSKKSKMQAARFAEQQCEK